jgi:hypothetical protein
MPCLLSFSISSMCRVKLIGRRNLLWIRSLNLDLDDQEHLVGAELHRCWMKTSGQIKEKKFGVCLIGLQRFHSQKQYMTNLLSH